MLKRFYSHLDASPTPFHCVHQAVARLNAAGFSPLSEAEPWSLSAGGKYYFTRNASSLVAFVVGGAVDAATRTPGFKAVGAHTDSPVLKIKPLPARSSHGYLQLGVETYGGGLWHTWFDRDLSIAGRVIVRGADGIFEEKLVHIKKPILRVPNLAIHLTSREERGAFKVNKENHLSAILGQCVNADSDEDASSLLLGLLAKELSVEKKDILDVELTMCDTQPSAIGGLFDELIFGPRLDNQMHCFTSLEALLGFASSKTFAEDDMVSAICLFDHEEVGSQSPQGAGSVLMRDFFHRVTACLGAAKGTEAHQIALARSFLISADGAHAIHPNYASKHETNHQPKLNAGTVIKTNSNMRYATNGFTGFVVREIARRAGVKVQEFVVRQDCPCGTTIGPILSANTGIRTVDIGMPQLSMHSIRETCGAHDLASNVDLLQTFFQEFNDIDKNTRSLTTFCMHTS